MKKPPEGGELDFRAILKLDIVFKLSTNEGRESIWISWPGRMYTLGCVLSRGLARSYAAAQPVCAPLIGGRGRRSHEDEEGLR